MASDEHKQLSNIIKSIHQNLRLESHKVGEDHAWKNHCLQKEVLKTYATAMKELATEFWAKSAGDSSNKRAQCRVGWIVKQCHDYYFSGGCCEALRKESVLSLKYGMLKSDDLQTVLCSKQESNRLKVLDVGSCYNPFINVPYFDVLPIDIAPASNDVVQCDFLSVLISEETPDALDGKISVLTALSFDIVVFSLLLEYFPSSKQRFICCKKASKLLKSGGLLCIVTPDSKHATANSKIMKMWRHALACIGFLRVKYEKLPHLHCMIYRKCFIPQVSLQWACVNSQNISKKAQFEIEHPEELLVIPQDFHVLDENDSKNNNLTNYIRDEDDRVASFFTDLPQI